MYDNNENTQWIKRYNGSLDYYDDPLAIATDDKGNVYITGISNMEPFFDPAIPFLRYTLRLSMTSMEMKGGLPNITVLKRATTGHRQYPHHPEYTKQGNGTNGEDQRWKISLIKYD